MRKVATFVISLEFDSTTLDIEDIEASLANRLTDLQEEFLPSLVVTVENEEIVNG